MYKIGIVGHSPEDFGMSEAQVCYKIEHVMALLQNQYGDDVIFNVSGKIGAGLWAAHEAQILNAKYSVYLPYSLEKTCEHWYPEQQELLTKLYGRAHSVMSCFYYSNTKDESYVPLILNSNFIVCFWVGKKQGFTYEAIKYALSTNKIAINAFNNLSLITNADFVRRPQQK